jgi:hypothetical protein
MATQDSKAGSEHHDSVSDELESMRRIAKALDALPDDDARQRVLQWAADRYHGTGTLIVPQPAAVMRTATDDPNLAVEELEDLFEPAAKPGTAATSVVASQPRAGVESMIKDFAADFRRFALEWQGA